jgi:nucleoside-diphosphate-sugar epimerase
MLAAASATAGGRMGCALPRKYWPPCSSINTAAAAAAAAAEPPHSINHSVEEEQAFFDSNVELTKGLTRIISETAIQFKTFVFISTVAVYGLEEGSEIDENFPLNGKSAYARSKILAEEHLAAWAKSNDVNLVILRLPLIFGDCAPGNLGAMERAIKGRYYFQIGKGAARRSMIHVKHLSEFLPTLIGKSGIYNLTDGYHPTYSEIAERFGKIHHRRIKSLPLVVIKPITKIGDFFPKFPLNSYRLSKLNQTLTFNDEKARKELGWKGSNALEI